MYALLNRFLVVSILLLGSGTTLASATNERHFTPQKFADNIIRSQYHPIIVDSVYDPSTFIVAGKRIKLWGIEAPYSHEPMYEISQKTLEVFLKDRTIYCKFVELDENQYDSIHCFLDDGDIAMLMVRIGFVREKKSQSHGFYDQEESYARANKLGLWE